MDKKLITKICPCGKQFETYNERRTYCCHSHRTKAYMLRKHLQKGQSLVEFAISLVVLLFLLVGAVEFGMVFFQFIQLQDAAQEGALYGSACPDVIKIEERVRGASNTPINLSDTSKVFVGISLEDKDGNPKNMSDVAEGDGLIVRVSFSHKIIMPFLPQMLGRTDIPLNAEVTDTVLKATCS